MGLMLGCLACGMSEAKSLTVASFNLRFGTANDGDNSWPYRKDLVVETIRYMHPDVLGTQECLALQAKYLADALPEYGWIGVGREIGGLGEMAAVFYRKNMLTPIDSGHFWLSETPEVHGSRSWNTSCTRMATWVRFRDINTHQVFQVFNTHFDHRSEEARAHSAKLMVERIQALPAKMPVIVTGDFNADAETSEAWKTFTANGFTYARQAAAECAGPDMTISNFGVSTGNPPERIDWILIRNGGPVSRWESVTFNRNGRFPSDHYPVVATIELKKKP